MKAFPTVIYKREDGMVVIDPRKPKASKASRPPAPGGSSTTTTSWTWLRSAPAAPTFSTGAGKNPAAPTPARPAPSSSERKRTSKPTSKGAVLLQPELGGSAPGLLQEHPQDLRRRHRLRSGQERDHRGRDRHPLRGRFRHPPRPTVGATSTLKASNEGTYNVEIKAGRARPRSFDGVSTKENSANLGT